MIVLKKEPVDVWYAKNIENTLEAMQAEVGGYIETVTLFTDCTIVCNDEGRINDMHYNTEIAGVDFFGPIMIVGTKGEEFCDVPASFQDFVGRERI